MMSSSIIFLIGNMAILIAAMPNIYRLLKTRSTKSFSAIGMTITWFGLIMFCVGYMLNDMWGSFILSIPGILFIGTVMSWKILCSDMEERL